MKIKSFGCSFTYGTDLSYIQHDFDVSITVEPTRPTWPALIAQHYALPYENHAWPGIGNLRILERVLHHARLHDPGLFIVNWSWTDRFDHLDTEYGKWQTLLPMQQDKTHELFYKNFYSQPQAILTNLIYIHTAINVLLEKNIPFYMTVIDPVLFDAGDLSWQDPMAISVLQQQVKKHISWFDGLDFLSWSRQNNFAISKTWHPLEQAHRAAADYVIKVFDTQKTIDQARQVLV